MPIDDVRIIGCAVGILKVNFIKNLKVMRKTFSHNFLS